MGEPKVFVNYFENFMCADDDELCQKLFRKKVTFDLTNIEWWYYHNQFK